MLDAPCFQVYLEHGAEGSHCAAGPCLTAGWRRGLLFSWDSWETESVLGSGWILLLSEMGMEEGGRRGGMRDESEDGDIGSVPDAIPPSGHGEGGNPIGRGDAGRNGDGVEPRLASENRAHVGNVDARLQVGRLAPVVSAQVGRGVV